MSAPTVIPTPVPTATSPAPTSTSIPRSASPSPASAPPVATPSITTEQQAFAAQYPTPMRATATAAYYAELVRTNRDLAAGGVTATALVTLEWGPILQQGATSDEAATFETWRHGHFTFAAKPWPGRRSGRPIVRDVTAARNRAGDTREGDAECDFIATSSPPDTLVGLRRGGAATSSR